MVRTIEDKSRYIPYEKKERVVVVRWGYEEMGDGSNLAAWTYEDFPAPVSLGYIRDMILNWYNDITDRKILNGFAWNDKPVYLSTENQFNFKTAYDLAVQTQGASLPVTFKLGEIDKAPVYHTFETMEEFTDFYTKTMKFINDTLIEGWAKKDAIDWSVYENPVEAENE